MNRLYPPEVIRAINGIGWTVVRGGRDEVSSFQNWIGENFDDFETAEKASFIWEEREPSFGIVQSLSLKC
jgi:hypothetical protein